MGIAELLIDYASGSRVDFEQFNEKEQQVRELFVEFNQDWESAECDAEGPTPEQDKEMDKIIKNYVSKIERVVNN